MPQTSDDLLQATAASALRDTLAQDPAATIPTDAFTRRQQWAQFLRTRALHPHGPGPDEFDPED